MNTMFKSTVKLAMVGIFLTVAPALTAQSKEELTVPSSIVDQIKSWANNSAVIDAINKQNEKHVSLSQDEIDRLDKQWRAETKVTNQPLIASVLANSLSAYLKDVKADAAGLYTTASLAMTLPWPVRRQPCIEMEATTFLTVAAATMCSPRRLPPIRWASTNSTRSAPADIL